MSCANTNLSEFMMRNHVEKLPVSQKIHFQIGDTQKHTISFYRSISYTITLVKLPDTTDAAPKIGSGCVNHFADSIDPAERTMFEY